MRVAEGAFLLCMLALGLDAQTAGILPSPTGALGVGRVSFHWIDSARKELVSGPGPAYRELMVDVWYPAETVPGRAPATYLPDLPAVEKVAGDAGAKKQFGAAYEQMVKGKLQTHAQEEAVFAHGLTRRPMLIFSHGLGVLKTSYTAQLEDLASHGYVVAAIAHTYDTALVTFPDGRLVRFDQERRRANSGSEHASIQYEDGRLKVWAADIRFVIDQLTRYDREADFQAPFQGHLDLARIGALGHSSGGRAAALACQTDPRVRACLNMDGVADNLPFYRDVQGKTMTQPFLLFVRKRKNAPPSDKELRSMGYSREELPKLIESIQKKQDDLLHGMPGGCYRVTLGTAGANHMSFSDLPLLEAADDAQYADGLRNLRIVCDYTRALFDKTLLGKRGTVLDRGSTSDLQVEWFPPRSAK